MIFDFLESVAYEWGSKGRGLIRYFYNEQKHPSTKVDIISLGFITPLENAVLLRVDSGTTQDYLEVDIVSNHSFIVVLTLPFKIYYSYNHNKL